MRLLDHPLFADLLPPSLVELRLRCNQPLTSRVLPSSSRRLSAEGGFSQPVQVGSLPEGLLFLGFHLDGWDDPPLPPLQPGVLPSTLLGIDFDNYRQPLPAGVVPSSVRCVEQVPGRADQGGAAGSCRVQVVLIR